MRPTKTAPLRRIYGALRLGAVVLLLGTVTAPADAGGSTGDEVRDLRNEVEALRRQLDAALKTLSEAVDRPQSRPYGAHEHDTPTLAELEQLLRDVRGLKRKLERVVDKIAELEGRSSERDADLERVEDEILNLEDRVGGERTLARAFDALELDIGGFLTQTFMTASGDDNTESSFNQTLFELLLKAQLSDEMSLFTALGFLREADLDLGDTQERHGGLGALAGTEPSPEVAAIVSEMSPLLSTAILVLSSDRSTSSANRALTAPMSCRLITWFSCGSDSILASMTSFGAVTWTRTVSVVNRRIVRSTWCITSSRSWLLPLSPYPKYIGP